jgi:hypothetical protein
MQHNFSRWFGQIIRLKVKSVTDSPYKMGLIVLGIAFVQTLFPQVPFFALLLTYIFAGILLLTGTIGFFYFAKKAPNYLRSEEYQLKRESHEFLGDKDNPTLDGKGDLASTTNIMIESSTAEQIK